MEYRTYVDDNRLTFMDKGVLLMLQQDTDFLRVDDILNPSETKEKVLESLLSLEKYKYIIKEPKYMDTDYNSKIFTHWEYKFNDKRERDNI